MFNSAIDLTQRDALHETDAILDHYTHHSNTAPFIANRLIQHLVTSNPSPRYVKTVSEAFRAGHYISGSDRFGSGNYGDLSAAIAAIYLDRESLSITLDTDATYGSVRAPILKVMHFIRAMELSSPEDREVTLTDLREKIGQESHNALSVFSFFLPEYQPVGPVYERGLLAPEAQLLDAPKLVGFINGLVSLPKYGLSECEWWSGLGEWNARYALPDHPNEGRFSCDQAADFNPETLAVPYRLRWVPSKWGGDTNILGAKAADVISELEILLTGGRLHSANRKVIETAYINTVALGGMNPDETALRVAQQLFAMTPEFQITNKLVDDLTQPEIRNITEISLPTDPPPTTDYKAIVYLFLNGGMDSFSVLIPHSNCNPSDLHQQYQDVRGDVAIDKSLLLPINVTAGTQPCNTFGVHPSLTTVKNLYDAGEASFVANIAPLVVPLTKDEYSDQIKEQPPALFAHNTQTRVTQTVYAQDATAGGILGRIGDTLNAQASKEIFDAYSISGTPKVLEGAPGASRTADVLNGNGVTGLVPTASMLETHINDLHSHVATSIFGETFSEKFASTLNRIKTLGSALDASALVNGDCASVNADTSIGKQFQQVARVIRSRDVLEGKRDVFYVEQWGYDTHSDNGPKLTELLTELNNAIQCFTDELKSQDIWDNVTVISASEFGRTLTSNGFGTDHAWGGNHFILGGSIDGGKIHGQFPDDLTDDASLNIGRGRLIPTTSWEALWHAVASWFGVISENIPSVLPNIQNFPPEHIMNETDVFKPYTQPMSPSFKPSKSSSKVPSAIPSDPPSALPSVTHSPSSSNNTGLTPRPVVTLGDDCGEWCIALYEISNVTFTNKTENELTLSYNMSHVNAGSAKTSIKSKSCSGVDQDAIRAIFVDERADLGGGFVKRNIVVNIKEDEIQESSLWVPDTLNNSSGLIEFCVVTEMMTELMGETVSVSFQETIVNILVNMTKGFEMIVEDVRRSDATEKDKVADVNYFINACLCEPNTCGCVARGISQNSMFSICITPNSNEVVVRSFQSLQLRQDNELKYTPIVAGSSDTLTTVDKSKVGCAVVTTRAVSAFYEGLEPSDITATGTVFLMFNRNVRNLRELDEKGTITDFNIKISLDASKDLTGPTIDEDTKNTTSGTDALLANLVAIICGFLFTVIGVIMVWKKRFMSK